MKNGATRRTPVPQVMLDIRMTGRYWPTLAGGAAAAIRDEKDCTVLTPEAHLGQHVPPHPNPSRDLSGCILRAWSEIRIDFWRDTGIPVVGVNNVLPSPFPHVLPDDEAIGTLAANFLVRLGLRQLASLGDGFLTSNIRLTSFAATAKAHGCQCLVRDSYPPDVQTFANDILERYPTGTIGVFASHDDHAESIISYCWANRIPVPHRVAVIGVGDDETSAVRSPMPISTIELSPYGVGWRAGKILLRLMAGDPPPGKPILVPPLRIIERASTDILGIDDPEIAAALHFIDSNAESNIGVGDVVGHLGSISRRSLERRFRDRIGRGISECIREAHVNRAKNLLRAPDLPLKQIASLSGFRDQQWFTKAFKASTGMTPGQYRKLTGPMGAEN